ncbi:hypothetical protein SAMN05421736_101154 [Evansella caseinilytica]|uniref:Uncharacterized protein n=1 Tax=Evansella caseinilytica TaxID=1503961 RepID=A0A1H3GG02_9BACI|nr:hypothetical protein [Evansella caseinilytica]SDY01987.1 hypothetical protein SAMN05421736_101154 [Evansella caseinilytica]
MLYVSAVTILLAVIVWLMPKNMQRRDIYILWISVSFVEIIVDVTLGSPVFGLYYFAGEDKVSPEALGLKLIMAPLFGVIYFNYMPKRFLRFLPYWLIWAAFSTFFEWTTVYFGYLTYKNWNLWYSALFYFAAMPLMRWHYFYIKHEE